MANRFWVLSLVFVLICLTWLPGRQVEAQGGQFTAVTEQVFGQRVDFTLTAVTDLSLTQATLTIRLQGGLEPRSTVVPFSQVEDGRYTATYTLDPRSLPLAPFAEITFWWEVESADGQVISVPAKTTIYEDDRFYWQRYRANPLSLHWTGDDVAVGEAAVAVFETAWEDMQPVLSTSMERPISVYIYPSSADLRTALSLNGYEWRQGDVDPSVGSVMVTVVNSKSAREELSQSLPHELTHLLLYQAAGPENYRQIPYWFKEGLARWFEVADPLAGDGVLATAVAQNTIYSMQTLCDPHAPELVELASAQSGSLVFFIQSRYGDRGLRNLVDAFAAGSECETAVADTLGLSLADLENAWLKTQQPRPAWQQFLVENAFWFLLLIAGFVIMGLLVWQPARR